jgi:hypothetical protein
MEWLASGFRKSGIKPRRLPRLTGSRAIDCIGLPGSAGNWRGASENPL